MSVGATPSSTIERTCGAVLPDVDEGGAGAVRAAIQIDPFVAEMRADVVEVVHRDAGRVEPDVGVIAGQARAQPVERLLVRLGQLLQRVRFTPALERMRLAGAALVNQDDVALTEDGAEYFAHLGRQLGRRLAWSTGQKEQRVGCRLGGQRRQGDDVERDAAPGPRIAVLVDFKRSAGGVGRALRRRAGVEPGQAGWGGRLGATGNRAEKRRGQEESYAPDMAVVSLQLRGV